MLYPVLVLDLTKNTYGITNGDCWRYRTVHEAQEHFDRCKQNWKAIRLIEIPEMGVSPEEWQAQALRLMGIHQ